MSGTKLNASTVAVIYEDPKQTQLHCFLATLHPCNRHRFKGVRVDSDISGQRFIDAIVLAEVDTSTYNNNEWFREFTTHCLPTK